jgi:hypothetical protein
MIHSIRGGELLQILNVYILETLLGIPTWVFEKTRTVRAQRERKRERERERDQSTPVVVVFACEILSLCMSDGGCSGLHSTPTLK